MGTYTPKKKRLEKREPVNTEQPSSQKFYCFRCGMAFGRQKGNFPVSHSPMYRGAGYLPWCNDCVDSMYDMYRESLRDDRLAMRRMCMLMDLYWSEDLYNGVEKTAGTMSRMRKYIAKTNVLAYIDKTFDNSLDNEAAVQATMVGVASGGTYSGDVPNQPEEEPVPEPEEEEEVGVPEEIVMFWGAGYKPTVYLELENRRQFWMGTYPEGTVLEPATEALLRQICILEITINRDSAAGKSIEKSVNALNALLASAKLRPDQKKEEEHDEELEGVPLGEWIRKWENTRPIPTPDPELQDVDGILRYITIWFFGHLSKSLGLKNSYCRLYEQEIEKLKVEHPEFEDDEDDELLVDLFGTSGSEQDEEAIANDA